MSSRFTDVVRRYFVLPALILSVAVGAWYWWISPRTITNQSPVASLPSVDQSSTQHTEEAAAQQKADSQARANTAARYVGTQACVACHADLCESVAHSAHGRSLNDVDLTSEPPDGEFEHVATGRRYRVYRQGKEFRHREFLRVEDGREITLADYPMRYTIGSGNHNRSYLVELGSYLVESTITWYVAPARWDMSPGYESYNTGFGRPVTYECLFCHTGRVEAISQERTHLQIPSMKIDCERCHGPGSSHVDYRSADTGEESGVDETIMNTARLGREKNEAVCAQCHLSGDAVVHRKGKQIRDFRPGDSIQDFCIHYSLQDAKNSQTIVGHVEQLHRSQCYQKSSTLTCVTCHSPHARLAAEDRIIHFRSACQSCHEQKPCGLPLPERLAKTSEDSCVDCHMPKRPSDIPHLAATQHQIGITWTQEPDERPHSRILKALGDISDLDQTEQDRYLGLAYLDLSIKDGNPSTSDDYRQRAQDLLEKVLSKGLNDSEVLVSLAQTYQRRNPRRDIELAEQALRSAGIAFELRVRALSTIADSHVALLETTQAIPVLEQLVTMRRQAADWYRLSACRLRAGELTKALVAGQQAVKIRPDLPNYHALLAEIYKQSGQLEAARDEEQLEQWLKRSVKAKER